MQQAVIPIRILLFVRGFCMIFGMAFPSVKIFPFDALEFTSRVLMLIYDTGFFLLPVGFILYVIKKGGPRRDI
jgi:hypothetical protein